MSEIRGDRPYRQPGSKWEDPVGSVMVDVTDFTILRVAGKQGAESRIVLRGKVAFDDPFRGTRITVEIGVGEALDSTIEPGRKECGALVFIPGREIGEGHDLLSATVQMDSTTFYELAADLRACLRSEVARVVHATLDVCGVYLDWIREKTLSIESACFGVRRSSEAEEGEEV